VRSPVPFDRIALGESEDLKQKVKGLKVKNSRKIKRERNGFAETMNN
jgi:hypothetical protein